jgi:hypothetical protein
VNDPVTVPLSENTPLLMFQVTFAAGSAAADNKERKQPTPRYVDLRELIVRGTYSNKTVLPIMSASSNNVYGPRAMWINHCERLGAASRPQE